MDVTIGDDFPGPCDPKCLSICVLCLMVMLPWSFFNCHKRTPVNRAYSQSDLEQALLLSLTGGPCKQSSSLSFAIACAVFTTKRQGACRLKKGFLKSYFKHMSVWITTVSSVGLILPSNVFIILFNIFSIIFCFYSKIQAAIIL